MGWARGSLSQLLQQPERWHQTWQQSSQETQQTTVCLSSHVRFGANSPGDCPGKFAHPRPAERELH